MSLLKCKSSILIFTDLLQGKNDCLTKVKTNVFLRKTTTRLTKVKKITLQKPVNWGFKRKTFYRPLVYSFIAFVSCGVFVGFLQLLNNNNNNRPSFEMSLVKQTHTNINVESKETENSFFLRHHKIFTHKRKPRRCGRMIRKFFIEVGFFIWVVRVVCELCSMGICWFLMTLKFIMW